MTGAGDIGRTARRSEFAALGGEASGGSIFGKMKQGGLP